MQSEIMILGRIGSSEQHTGIDRHPANIEFIDRADLMRLVVTRTETKSSLLHSVCPNNVSGNTGLSSPGPESKLGHHQQKKTRSTDETQLQKLRR